MRYDVVVAFGDLPTQEILRLARENGAHEVRVFGSRARGDAGPGSDLDLLVRFEDGRSLLDLVGLKLALEQLLGIRVDIVSEPGLSRYIRDRVLAEAKVLVA
jgi:predicted nucleotidyltransferase